MKVFSREKFIEVHGKKLYESCKGWVDKCDGKPVVRGWCEGFSISEQWCIDGRKTRRVKRKCTP